MKIAMYNVTTTVAHGGVETFVWEMARELAERGHEVHVIGGEGTVRRDIPGVKVITFPFQDRKGFPALGSRYRKFAERTSFARSALPFMKKERYDFVNILKPYDLPWAWQLKRSSGCRAVMISQGTDFFPGDRWFAKKIDGFTTCSRFNGGRIEGHFHTPAEVIYNGFNEKLFRPLPPDSELRKRLGVGDTEQVIIYAGRLVKLKGVHYLLEAFGLLKKKDGVRLLIIGDGPEREPLREKAIALGVADRVLFAGFIPNQDLPRYYSLAHAAVLPTVTEEAFGIAIAEAMACGIPVVATTVGGIPEVADAGLLVSPARSDEIAEKLAFLLEDEDRRRQIGEEGRRKVLELFTWSAVTDRLLRYYEKIGSATMNKKGAS